MIDLVELSRHKSLDKWREFFDQEDVILELEDIEKELEDKKELLPLKEDLFNPFRVVSPSKVKVCMIFDRPYASYDEFNKDKPISNGIGCGVNIEEPTTKINNIYKELTRCYRDFEVPTKEHTFTGWDRVLMLNCMMLVEPGSTNKSSIWLPFINLVIAYIENKRRSIFIICCGQDYENNIKGMIKTGHIITAPNVKDNSFVESGVFLECNRARKNIHKTAIRWNNINK